MKATSEEAHVTSLLYVCMQWKWQGGMGKGAWGWLKLPKW